MATITLKKPEERSETPNIDGAPLPEGAPQVQSGNAATFTPEWQIFFGGAIVLATAVALSPNKADPDLWGHVLYGNELLETGHLPRTATYTYTAEGYRWINHENLSEIALALLERLGGGTGLLVFKCLLGLGVLALALRRSWKSGVGFMVLGVTALLVSFNLTYHWSVRPQIFTYAYFALMIALLDGVFPARETRDGNEKKNHGHAVLPDNVHWLWLLVPLFAVWANTHGGFVAGYAILAAFLFLKLAELAWERRREAWPRICYPLGVLAACGLATLANPYGWKLWTWLYGALSVPRPEVSEWGALRLGDEIFLPFLLLAGFVVFGLAGTREPRDLTRICLLGLTAWQAVEHSRHIPFFALLAAFWLPTHVASAVKRFQTETARQSPTSRREGRWLAAGLVVVLALLGGRLALRLHALTVDKSEYPVTAFRFMANHGLHGKMVVSMKWAQYALAAFGDRSTLQFDGRYYTCYPPEVVDMHFDFLLGDVPGMRHRQTAGPVDPTRVLEHGLPDLVVVDRHCPHAELTMRQQGEDWVRLYQDGLAQIWGRAARYDNPESPDYLPPRERQIGQAPQKGFVAWPALPEKRDEAALSARHAGQMRVVRTR